MEHHMIGPFWGNVIIIGIASAMTLGCFIAMFWMLLRPGERDCNHPKYRVLHDDR